MAEPADHVCFPLDVDGVTAIVHGDPGMSGDARAALADVIRAATRMTVEREAAMSPEERARVGRLRGRSLARITHCVLSSSCCSRHPKEHEMASTITVEVHTTDTAWIAKHTTGTREERVVVPGCTITGTYRFCGREWVNYRLPKGTPLPKDWDKGVQNCLAAPADWTHQ